VTVRTWADSQVYGLGFDWLAIGKRPPPATSMRSYDLSDVKKEGWVDTGIHVPRGARVEVRCTGSLSLNGIGYMGPEGNLDVDTPGGDRFVGTAHAGAVVGRVGTTVFEVGKLALIDPTNFEGNLELAINDGCGFYADNSGSVRVEVSVW
jgi:hypothetical protein